MTLNVKIYFFVFLAFIPQASSSPFPFRRGIEGDEGEFN